MSIRTVALVFGDNDFGKTFKPLLESLHRAIALRADDGDELSKQEIVELINSGIEFHYRAFQYDSSRSQGVLSVEHIVKYLRSVRVLFDEEAELDIQNVDHDGGAWYLETATGEVYYY